jgi:hypothetical protein
LFCVHVLNMKLQQRRLQRSIRQRGSERAETLHAADDPTSAMKTHGEAAAHLQRRKGRLSAQHPRCVVPLASHVLGGQDLQQRRGGHNRLDGR